MHQQQGFPCKRTGEQALRSLYRPVTGNAVHYKTSFLRVSTVFGFFLVLPVTSTNPLCTAFLEHLFYSLGG